MPTAHKNTFIFLIPRSFQPSNCDRCSGAESVLHFTFSPPCTRRCMSAHTQNKGRAARAHTHTHKHPHTLPAGTRATTRCGLRSACRQSRGGPQPPGSPDRSGPWARRTAQAGPRREPAARADALGPSLRLPGAAPSRGRARFLTGPYCTPRTVEPGLKSSD